MNSGIFKIGFDLLLTMGKLKRFVKRKKEENKFSIKIKQ